MTTENQLYALSLWQPWASLWLTSSKVHETRHWSTKYRGMLYVHAAKRPVDEDELSDDLIAICHDNFGDRWWDLPLGAVIGIVDLVDCVQFPEWGGVSLSPAAHRHDFACGDFTAGRFGWKRGPSPTHIGPWPYKGRQGIFRCDDLDAVVNKVLGVA